MHLAAIYPLYLVKGYKKPLESLPPLSLWPKIFLSPGNGIDFYLFLTYYRNRNKGVLAGKGRICLDRKSVSGFYFPPHFQTGHPCIRLLQGRALAYLSRAEKILKAVVHPLAHCLFCLFRPRKTPPCGSGRRGSRRRRVTYGKSQEGRRHHGQRQ